MYRSGVRSSSAPLHKALRSNELRKAFLFRIGYDLKLSPHRIRKGQIGNRIRRQNRSSRPPPLAFPDRVPTRAKRVHSGIRPARPLISPASRPLSTAWEIGHDQVGKIYRESPRKEAAPWFSQAKGVGVPIKVFERHSGVFVFLTRPRSEPSRHPGPLQSRHRPSRTPTVFWLGRSSRSWFIRYRTNGWAWGGTAAWLAPSLGLGSGAGRGDPKDDVIEPTSIRTVPAALTRTNSSIGPPPTFPDRVPTRPNGFIRGYKNELPRPGPPLALANPTSPPAPDRSRPRRKSARTE